MTELERCDHRYARRNGSFVRGILMWWVLCVLLLIGARSVGSLLRIWQTDPV